MVALCLACVAFVLLTSGTSHATLNFAGGSPQRAPIHQALAANNGTLLYPGTLLADSQLLQMQQQLKNTGLPTPVVPPLQTQTTYPVPPVQLAGPAVHPIQGYDPTLRRQWLPQAASSTPGGDGSIPGWAADNRDFEEQPLAQSVPATIQAVPLQIQTQQQSVLPSVGTAVQQKLGLGVGVRPVHTAQSSMNNAATGAAPQLPPVTGLSISKDTARLSLSSTGTGSIMTIEQIKEALPHRYPFLLVDRVLHLEKGRRGIGVKQVSANEQFFEGHFPDKPVMPGVLQVEALAQLAGIIFSDGGRLFLFTGVQTVKWRRTVVPGDTLVLEVEVVRAVDRRGFVECKGWGYVGGKVAVEVQGMTFKSIPL